MSSDTTRRYGSQARPASSTSLAFKLRPLRHKSDILFPLALILSGVLHFGAFTLIMMSRGASGGPVFTGPVMVKLADLPSGKGGKTSGEIKQADIPKPEKETQESQESKTSLPGKEPEKTDNSSGLGHEGPAGLGGEKTGVILDEASFRYEWYKARLEDLLKSHWRKPMIESKKSITASVHFKITASGDAISIRILSTSGNSDFDKSVLRAVYDSVPFPRFPPQYQSPTLGVMYTFELLPEGQD